MKKKAIVIGGGIAGVEAAYQIAKRGINVELYEMRPKKTTEVHSTSLMGELVCSNSLGSTEIQSASGLLKEELKLMDSFFLRIAANNRVPAGSSFSVDRFMLAKGITDEINAIAKIKVIRKEITDLPIAGAPVIVATGPLTSSILAESLTKITMRKNLFFYDATSPIIEAKSIDYNQVFKASRYEKGNADFLNIPLNEGQYKQFVEDLITSEKVEIKDFEKNIFFESCLPVEEIAKRGEKSLSFGPLKPVGLINPKTGSMPYAVVQLRQDDLKKNFFQMVGFQTRLKWGEQKRVFSKLPGLSSAKFERYGRMHRNTYLIAPLTVTDFFRSKQNDNIYFAGQICGVEGYVESIASGLIAGIHVAKTILQETTFTIPVTTAVGSLVHYISHADWKNFKPTKFSFGLLPDISQPGIKKKEKKKKKAELALKNLSQWIKKSDI